jgi:hypothetical protein
MKAPYGLPMDLANMRDNGIRELLVECRNCYHSATLNVDAEPGNCTVSSFANRMKCSRCGGTRVDVPPAWNTKPVHIPKPGPGRP